MLGGLICDIFSKISSAKVIHIEKFLFLKSYFSEVELDSSGVGAGGAGNAAASPSKFFRQIWVKFRPILRKIWVKFWLGLGKNQNLASSKNIRSAVLQIECAVLLNRLSVTSPVVMTSLYNSFYGSY